jgi:hypothetical protein
MDSDRELRGDMDKVRIGLLILVVFGVLWTTGCGSFDLGSKKYYCQTDSDCASGYVCDRNLHYCVRPDDLTHPDAMDAVDTVDEFDGEQDQGIGGPDEGGPEQVSEEEMTQEVFIDTGDSLEGEDVVSDQTEPEPDEVTEAFEDVFQGDDGDQETEQDLVVDEGVFEETSEDIEGDSEDVVTPDVVGDGEAVDGGSDSMDAMTGDETFTEDTTPPPPTPALVIGGFHGCVGMSSDGQASMVGNCTVVTAKTSMFDGTYLLLPVFVGQE